MNSPTWWDLNSPSIFPPLGARQARRLGPDGILIACEPDLRLLRTGKKQLQSRSFFNSTLICLEKEDGGIAVAGPFIGAPYAVMLLESMIAQGVRQALFLGWCGAVSDTLDVGDLVVPERAIVDEGTSVNYIELDARMPVVEPDVQMTDRLMRYIETQKVSCCRETIWTTDAIYRETSEKVAHFRAMGARAVEMECSALFSVGRFRKVPVAALLVVSDSVASTHWNPGFRKERFKAARQDAVRIVTGFMGYQDENGPEDR